MLSEKDKAVIYSMCMTGMKEEVLVKSFPQFDREDIETVYKEYTASNDFEYEEISISCNCS